MRTDVVNDDFEKLLQNAVVYGMGLLIMQYKNGEVSSRVVPQSEYLQLGEHLVNFPELADLPKDTNDR